MGIAFLLHLLVVRAGSTIIRITVTAVAAELNGYVDQEARAHSGEQ